MSTILVQVYATLNTKLLILSECSDPKEALAVTTGHFVWTWSTTTASKPTSNTFESPGAPCIFISSRVHFQVGDIVILNNDCLEHPYLPTTQVVKTFQAVTAYYW